jgi:hypothetical protein
MFFELRGPSSQKGSGLQECPIEAVFSSAAGPWRKMVQMAHVEAYQQANRDHDFVWQIVFEFVLKICLPFSR